MPVWAFVLGNGSTLSMCRQCELQGTFHSCVYVKHSALDEEKHMLRKKLMARLDHWYTMLPARWSWKLAVKLQKESYTAAGNWCDT